MTTEPTTFNNISEHIDEVVAANPEIAATVVEMWAEQARHRSGLAAIRSVVGITQADLARELGISQSAVAQAEAKSDLMASTLVRNLAVLNADVFVRFSDQTEVGLREVLAAGPDAAVAEARQDA